MASRLRSRTALVVAALLVLALALRIGEVHRTTYRPVSDGASYLTLASVIAHTGDYPDSHAAGTGAGGSRGPTAYFPPAFPYLLAAVDLIDGHTASRDGAVQPARYSQAVVGTAVVAMVGLVAFEALGELVGVIALALAAVYPVFIELSAVLVAENLMTLLVLAAIWAALRLRRSARPHAWTALAGVLTGLATLTHQNSIVLVVPLGIAVWSFWAREGAPRLARVGAIALLLVATFLTLTPWAVRNALELHDFVPVADEIGMTLAGTYNAGSAANHQIPYKWRLFNRIPGEPAALVHPAGIGEAELSSRLESQALHYIGKHPIAPLAVLYDNTRRLLELEGSSAWRDSTSSIGLPLATARVGVASFWVLLLVAIAGLFTPLARRSPWWMWLAPVLLWLSAALINGETPRFREPIDPFLIMLAACAIAELARRAVPRLAAPARRQRRTAVASGSRQLVEMRKRLA